MTKKYELTIEHLKFLWNVLVKKSVLDVERNYYLNWLTRQKEQSSQGKRNFTVSDTLVKNMFSAIFMNNNMMDNYQNISIEILNGIQELFFGLNQRDDYLEPTSRNLSIFKVNRPESIIGGDFFWNTLINSQNEQVRLFSYFFSFIFVFYLAFI